MTAPNGFDNAESYGSYEDFEWANEATIRDHRRPAQRIFAPGGLSSATLNTPRGPAKLNLPSAVPTLQQYRTLEQALNTTNARLNAATADLARLRQELAARQDGGMMTWFPLLMQKQLRDDLEGHTHAGSTAAAVLPAGGSGFSSFLPFLFLQPGLFGQAGGSTPASGAQGGMSQMIMMMFMMEIFRDRGA